MAVAFTIKATGVEKVQRALKALRPPASTKAIVAGLDEMARTVQDEATQRQIIRGGEFKTSSIGVAAAAFNIKGRRGSLRVNPDRLTSRTGNLRSSIQVSRRRLPKSVEVGTHLKYGRAHELGFTGTVNVRAHQRDVAFGRKVKRYTVPSHRRKVNIRRRPFLEPAIKKQAPNFTTIMLREIDKRVPK